MKRLKENTEFEKWCYEVVDPNTKNLISGESVPLLTTLLYRICLRDHEIFSEATEMLQIAFEAGQKVGVKANV